MKGTKKGIGLKYALNGLFVIIKEERNFKIHLIIAFIVIMFGFIVRLTYIEWAIIVLTIFIVLLMELINSVIERLIDYLKPEIHTTAKVIKDMSAAIVLLAAFMSVIIGIIIFTNKFNVM